MELKQTCIVSVRCQLNTKWKLKLPSVILQIHHHQLSSINHLFQTTFYHTKLTKISVCPKAI